MLSERGSCILNPWDMRAQLGNQDALVQGIMMLARLELDGPKGTSSLARNG
jgi:hypothetical protein